MKEIFKKIYAWSIRNTLTKTLSASLAAMIGIFAVAYLPPGAAEKVTSSIAAVLSCGDIECPVSSTNP